MSAVASWSCPTACGLVRGGTRIECTEPRTGSPAVPDCYLISVAVWTALLLITVGGIRRWMRFDRFWIRLVIADYSCIDAGQEFRAGAVSNYNAVTCYLGSAGDGI